MKLKTNLKFCSHIISPVPLVDIFVLIIVFFVLAVNFVGQSGLLFDLPTASTISVYNDNLIKIRVTGAALFLNNKKIDVAELTKELLILKTENSNSILVIEAGKNAGYADILNIIDLVKDTGFNRFAIAAGEKT